MGQVSKFIPMEVYGKGMGEENNNNAGCGNVRTPAENAGANSSFKVCGASSNLPTKKSSFWTKLRGILTYEINVELTPKQQKIEDEINEFLHQEITWQSFKNFLFQDVTFAKKG